MSYSEYEYCIYCIPCACEKGVGGFSEPQILSNDQVLADMEHNPGCPIPDMQINDPGDINIASEQQGNVMVYTITSNQ
jgi:hypothetical protein